MTGHREQQEGVLRVLRVVFIPGTGLMSCPVQAEQGTVVNLDHPHPGQPKNALPQEKSCKSLSCLAWDLVVDSF